MTQNSTNAKQPLVQCIYSVLTGSVTINSSIVPDNTIPQITEGNEVITCTITPTDAANKLVVKAMVWISAASSANSTIALFQDATAGALAASEGNLANAAGWLSMLTLFYAMTAGTTSATTFRIRVGKNGGNLTVNPAEFGGVQTSYMEVWEIKA